MRSGGATIEEILAELSARGVKVSRSALGRHTQKIDELGAGSDGALRADLRELRRTIGAEHELLLAEIRLTRGAVTRLEETIRASAAAGR